MNRIGEQNKNKSGSIMTIVEYRSYRDITVEFDDGYKTDTTFTNFKNGSVKSPYDKISYNIGYIGEGSYSTSIQGEQTIQYQYWRSMLKRCYDLNTINRQPTYEDKYVCEEWHNFQTFAKWFDENYYEVDRDKMCLDKDILFKGNKIYSPKTCVFVPQRINNIILSNKKTRGKYPIGVRLKDKGFHASCNIYEDSNHYQKHLGIYSTPEEAFRVYKKFKEQYMKEVAEEYKNIIPIKLYEAMNNYIVEIDD